MSFYKNQQALLYLLMMLLFLAGCSQPELKQDHAIKHAYTNALAKESSPYLLQHAHNPVNWQPWGEKALSQAKREDKPIIISIGYAACHWCHVMEKESFEDLEVAKLMNEKFICIKVDREERPDVDQVYMNAAQLLTGSGGWPLNAVALPDGRPFFAGTYFPKEDWVKVLNKIQELYTTDRPKINEIASELTQGIKNTDLSEIAIEKKALSSAEVTTAAQNWKSFFDTKEGGYLKAPKFPLPQSWASLLSYYQLKGDEKLLDQVMLTLDKMAYGGIYDQVGGGFARYSTDKVWKVPHFEKMLYDNAQLISLYSKAYKITQKPLYKRVVMESLAFVERELYDKKTGSFYSSLDADSEGEEGKYYAWTAEELETVLGNDANWFAAYFNVRPKGNWDGLGNILYATDTALIKVTKLNAKVAEQRLISSKKKLLKAREKRIKPGLDNKILTSWNALMLKAYLEAYQAFGDEKLLKTGLQLANFLLNTVRTDGYRLTRNYKDGNTSINGFLDDYALVIDAYLSLYQSTFDENWLLHAQGFAEYAMKHFYDEKSGYFFYTSSLDPALVARKIDLADNVIPASNSVMAKNLFYLGTYFYKKNYQEKAEQMLLGIKSKVMETPSYYSNWFELMLLKTQSFYEVAIVGADYQEKLKAFHRKFIPNAILLGGSAEGGLELLENKLIEGQTRIYVCRDKACKLPVTEVEKALAQMK